MKKKYILLIFIFLIGITSCQKASINGDLDGMWQLMKIEKKDKPTEVLGQLYYCIQLHMVQLQGAATCHGTFSHKGDSIYLVIRGSNKSEVAAYGMNDTIQSFGIENLSSEKMILNSSYARLQFRKF
jgi:hypothetical protein